MSLFSFPLSWYVTRLLEETFSKMSQIKNMFVCWRQSFMIIFQIFREAKKTFVISSFMRVTVNSSFIFIRHILLLIFSQTNMDGVRHHHLSLSLSMLLPCEKHCKFDFINFIQLKTMSLMRYFLNIHHGFLCVTFSWC